MFRLDYWYNAAVFGGCRPEGSKGICQYYRPELKRIRKGIEAVSELGGYDKDGERVVRFDLGNVVFRDDKYKSREDKRFAPMSLQTNGSEKDLNDLAFNLGLAFDRKQVVEY